MSEATTLPLTIIGGYLGAGKTTLLNHLLRHADGLKLAVLVNDFGDLAIDADLIEAEDDQMISIAGGCVCCSFGDDLTQALLDLAKLDPTPDHVLLETSGVALPGAIAASLLFAPGYSHDGTIVLANAETVQAQAGDTYVGDTIHRQLKDADLILLNKVDLVGDGAEEIAKWLGSLAPQAEVVQANHGQVPREVLLQSYLGAPRDASHVHVHDADTYASLYISTEKPVDVAGVAERLASPDLGLYRAKGFLTDDQGARQTVQVVARRWEVTDAPDGAKNGLVVIGARSKLTYDAINAILSEHTCK